MGVDLKTIKDLIYLNVAGRNNRIDFRSLMSELDSGVEIVERLSEGD